MAYDEYIASTELNPSEAVHSVKSLDRESRRREKRDFKKPTERKKDSVKISTLSNDEEDEKVKSKIVVNELKDKNSPDKKGGKIDIVVN